MTLHDTHTLCPDPGPSLRRWTIPLLLAALQASALQAQPLPGEPTSIPAQMLVQAAPPPPIPAPTAQAWPGVLQLDVDATDLDHRILTVRETLTVAPGRLTLLYPRWLPGNHAPTGNINQLAGLVMRAGEQVLDWQRDTLDTHAFHVEVPTGVRELSLEFQHLSPHKSGDARVTMTPTLVGVQWNTVLLYPAGHHASAIQVRPRLRLPAGWKAATALRGADGGLVRDDEQGWLAFGIGSLESLVDSPVFAGPHFRRIELDPPGTPRPVALNLLADEADQLQASEPQIAAHKALVVQADRLFASRHWRHYDFLLAQSREFSGIGLEHQESSENGVRPGYFKDWDKAIGSRELLPHEFTHSWNGKYRRPADLWVPQFNVPMRDSLLWVYEGQTQFWGQVLAVRSGLVTPAQARDSLAQIAASAQGRVGRVWRNLQDTTREGVMAAQRDKPWGSWQRGRDYYNEGALIWLDADSLIRERSAGKRSLDQFARLFFGPPHASASDGAVQPRLYGFDDVVRTLQQVQAHDWAAFLRQRLDSREASAPLAGLERSGWRLAWSDKESEFSRAEERRGSERAQDLSWSLGLRVAADGKLDSVQWNSPGFDAGLAPGQQLVAVGMKAYTPERLAAAIQANRSGQAPVALLMRIGDQFRQTSIDWRGGLRYPKLERIEGTPDRLADLYAPRP